MNLIVLVSFLLFVLVGAILFVRYYLKLRSSKQNQTSCDELDDLPCGLILSSFNYKNRSERDYCLTYSKELKSYCCDDAPLHYINEIIDSYFPKFDVEGNSRRLSQRSGEDALLIREKWDATTDEARRVGQFLQRQITNILVGRVCQVNYKHVYVGKLYRSSQFVSIISEINQFQEFRQHLSGTSYRSDWLIYDETTKIVATVDLLEQDEDGKFHLYEWTRSKTMGKERDGSYELQEPENNGVGKAPLEHVPDTQFYRIALKMNFLRSILSKNYQIQVDRLTLVVFHASLQSFHTLSVPFMESEVELMSNEILKSEEKNLR